MGLLDIAEKPLVFNLDEKLSKAISKLKAEGKNEAFVFDKRGFVGIISASDIDRKGITDPENVKLGALENMIRNIKVLDPDTEIRELVNKFVINNYRCVPIEANREILSVSKLNLLKLIPPEAVKNYRASDVMFFPQCVSPGDPVSVAKSLFRDSNSYRLAVVGSGNKVEGVVDELDLLGAFVEHKRSARGERAGEKIKEREVPISSLLTRESYVSLPVQTELKYVVQKMLEKNNDTVVVEEDGKLVGMITPREILKLVGAEIAGVYVNLSGIQDEDSFLQNLVNSEIRSSIRKLAKILHIHYMSFNVKRRANPSEGAKTKGRVSYNVKGKLVSNKGAFFADDTSWDLTKSTQSVLKKLEREAMKKVSKERDRRTEVAIEEDE